MELLKYVNGIRNERCHNRSKYCNNKKYACSDCFNFQRCVASCIKSCNIHCSYKDKCNSLIKAQNKEGEIKMNEILYDENKNPLLFDGKEMTLEDFKRCIGRVDDEWVEYMNLVLNKKRENKLIIGK